MSNDTAWRRPLRVGVLGAGSHSRRHHGPALAAFAQRHPQRIELAAVCDRDGGLARNYAQRFGFARSYEDIERMCDRESLEALVCVTPVALTHAIISSLLPRRIPLLIEKPPGLCLEQTLGLRDLAHRYGTPHMVSCNRRFSPPVRTASRWLARFAAEGSPQSVHARMRRIGRSEPDFVIQTGYHLIDTALALLQVQGDVHRFDPSHIEHRGRSVTASFEMGGGRRVELEIDPDAAADEERYTVQGPGFAIEVEYLASTIRVTNRGQVVCGEPSGRGVTDYQGAYAETVCFLDGSRRCRFAGPTLSDAAGVMRIAEALSPRVVEERRTYTHQHESGY